MVAAGAIYLTVGLFTDEATEFGAAVLLAVCAWALTAALVALAVGVSRRRAWARGPVVTVQILALPVAWSALTSEKWYLGGLLLGAALVGLTGVHPDVLGRAGGERQRQPESSTPPR
jgi:hypothetical protein